MPRTAPKSWLLLACCLLAAALWPRAGGLAAQPEEPQVVPGGVLVGIIDGDIDLGESAYVKRLIDAAEARDAVALVLEINTFGGRVDAAVAIRDALIDLELPTVAFINKRAISAGALISLACDKIAISPGGTIGAATPVVSAPGQEIPQPVEEKYLSYFRQEMRVTAETHGRNGDIAEALVDADVEVEGISEKGKLLTLTTRTALEHGFADVEASSVAEALEGLGITGAVDELERTWSEGLVAFLTSPAIAALLSFAMFFLAYMEYQTPGFGVFGFSALGCFLLLYFSHYLVNLAGWEELLLFVLGAALLAVEAFVLPGFGIAGIFGLLALVASLTLILMAGDWSQLHFENPFTAEALMRVTVTALAGVLGLLLMLRLLPKSEHSVLGGRLMLGRGLESTAGYRSHEPPRAAAADAEPASGVALTPLRPAGKARLDGRRLDVETEGEFIDSGEAVRVLRREPGRIVVRRA